jgi:NDP-4-keto-2,6-dideoxyhexose 3-C-methyltransferase
MHNIPSLRKTGPQASGMSAKRALYSETIWCRSCGNGKLIPILDLGEHALTGHFPGADEPDPPIAPLKLVICDVTSSSEACGLVQLGHTCEINQMYGPTYAYRSSITNTMVAHLHQTAAQVVDLAKPVSGDWILEIGSNDGTVQNYLAGRGYNLVAIDPSAAKFVDSYPTESKLIVDFFSVDSVKTVSQDHKFKAIISVAMFYDLDQPLDFMRDVRRLLDKKGVWCFEQAYLPAMLTSLCYDTICHEHLSYYGLAQIDWMAKRAGLRLIDISMNDINGGSFAVFACREEAPLASNAFVIERILASEARLRLGDAGTWSEFARRVRHHRARVRTFFEDARATGDLVLGLGASTKGNVILQYAGIDSRLMPAIGERDPLKVGLRTPKTGIPIISEDKARGLNPRFFFVAPWHFRDEIVSREKAFLHVGGRMVFPLPHFEIIRDQSSVTQSEAPIAAPKISWAKPMLFDDERMIVTEALDSTMISGGYFVDEFERLFARMHDYDEPAVSTTNGTAALHLAYLALGIGPGDEVIVPGWGFMAAANMALTVGATPVFADIDEDHWVMDPAEVAAKIGKKTKAIVAVHTYGNLCDVSRLGQIARDAGVALIEDCAESLGSKWSGRICGTTGDIATFSFQATKIVTCGEGGAILCRSAETAARVRLIRNHAMSGRKRYWHHAVGHNFRLTNIHCALLCAQLGHWPEIVASRSRLDKAYHLRLSKVPGLTFQAFCPEVEPVIWAVGLRVNDADEALRDGLLDLMLGAGIECRPGFYPPSAQSIYRAKPLRRADLIASQVIVPPIDPTLTEQSFDRICEVLADSLEVLKHG